MEVAGLGHCDVPAEQAPGGVDMGAITVGIRPETLAILYEGESTDRRVVAVSWTRSSIYWAGDMTYYDVRVDGGGKPLTISMKNLIGRPVLEVRWGGTANEGRVGRALAGASGGMTTRGRVVLCRTGELVRPGSGMTDLAIVLWLDLLGTFVFAISGAMLAVAPGARHLPYRGAVGGPRGLRAGSSGTCWLGAVRPPAAFCRSALPRGGAGGGPGPDFSFTG